MALTTTMQSAAHATPRLSRLLSVAGAALAAVAVWTVAVPILGTHLFIRFGSGAPESVGIGYVVGAGLIASALGWGLLALLERRTSHACETWTAIAVVALLASFSLPLIAGVTTSTKVVLALMHVAVAVVLIPALRRGSPPARVQ